VAQEVCWLLIFAIAEHVWTLVQVFTLVTQLVRHQFDLIPELLVANVAFEMALGDTLEPVLAVLRDVRSDGYVVPVETDPVLNLW